MKKLFTLLLTIALALSLAACSNNSSVAEIGEKEKETNVEVNWNEDYVFVDIDSVDENGKVSYSTSNGTQVNVSGNVDYSKPGTYQATISYTNSSGKLVEKETYVVVDTPSNQETRKEEVKQEIEKKEEQAKTENYTASVNNKTLSIYDDSIYTATLSEAEEYAKSVWGEGSYEVKSSPKGDRVFINYKVLSCEEGKLLFDIYQNGGMLSISNAGDTNGYESYAHGCGIW